MELETSQLDLETIKVKGSFEELKPERVEYLANAIASVGGMIQVPVVKQTGPENYELIHGYFEYQAYLKAREINPKLPDRMRVFVITKKNEQAIQQQIEVFKTLSDGNGKILDANLTIRFDNLASAIDLLRKEVKSATEESQGVILGAIDDRILKPLPLLEVFNRIGEQRVAADLQKRLEGSVQKKKAQKIVELLQEHRQQHPHQVFTKFGEILEILGKGIISKEKMLDFVDNWQTSGR